MTKIKCRGILSALFLMCIFVSPVQGQAQSNQNADRLEALRELMEATEAAEAAAKKVEVKIKTVEAEEKDEAAEESDEPEFVNCYQYYQETETCPKEQCNLGCLGGIIYEDCEIGCEPKPCFEIPLEHCPTSVCQIQEGCEGVDVCFPQNDYAPPRCGDLAYSGSDVECCPGYVKRCGIEFFDGTCDMAGRDSIYGVPICLPCGNGICNQFENACNCPEDCRRRHTINIEYTPIQPRRSGSK